MQVYVVYKHNNIYTPKWIFNIVLYAPCVTQNIKFIRPTLHAMKCSYNRHTVCHMFRHFLKVIFRESFYRLKSCPSDWYIMRRAVSH